jgi:fructose-bisphosphate aldolase, class I
MHESNPTYDRLFAAAGTTQTEPARRAYREMTVTKPDLGGCTSNAILHNKTTRQHPDTGIPFAQADTDAGIIPRHQSRHWRDRRGRPPRRTGA